jgi:hypothetical protein
VYDYSGEDHLLDEEGERLRLPGASPARPG